MGVALVEVGTNKIYVIKVVKDLTGRGLREAKDFVDSIASGPRLIATHVSAAQAEEIRASLEAVGAVGMVVTAKNGSALAKALIKAEEERAAAEKAAAELQARRDAVLALLRDKAEDKLNNFAEDLEIELELFKRQLAESGVDVSLLPESRVTANSGPSVSMLSLVVTFQH
jgi:hypothetical protein